jgi:hypothetical protein
MNAAVHICDSGQLGTNGEVGAAAAHNPFRIMNATNPMRAFGVDTAPADGQDRTLSPRDLVSCKRTDNLAHPVFGCPTKLWQSPNVPLAWPLVAALRPYQRAGDRF